MLVFRSSKFEARTTYFFTMTLPIVAVVGRPNVGKSTLINRIASNRATITHQMPGVTRDRKYVEVEWFGKDFVLIDTGGFEFDESRKISSMISRQATLAIEEAQSVVFVVDAKDGVNPYDQEIADILRKTGKNIYLAVNKVDTEKKTDEAAAFYALGIGEVYPISAAHGLGINELFDDVAESLPEAKEQVDDERLSIAIVGRPNVGKSSLLNKLLGQERVIVSDIPGTTRDAIDSIVTFNNREWRFIDTAGIRKKQVEDVEYYGLVRTFEVLDRADIALVILDASEAVTEQDQRIIDYTASRGCGLILLMNKWDLVDEYKIEQLERDIKRKLHFVQYAPLQDISVKTGRNLAKIFELMETVETEYNKEIKTSELNKFIRNIDLESYPSKHKIRLSYANQAGTKPPRFFFFIHPIKAANSNLRRFLEGRLRKAFGFHGTPVKILFKEKNKT